MIKRSVILGVSGVAVLLLGLVAAACASAGVSESEYSQVKQQLQQLQSERAAAPILLIGAQTAAPPAPPAPAPAGVVPPPPPVPPASIYEPVGPFFFSVQTLIGGATKYGLEATMRCVPTGMFARGSKLVWRIDALDATTGKLFTDQDGSAKIRLPHGEEVVLRFQQLGGNQVPDAPWSWTSAWDIPPDYAVGFLNYEVLVTGKDGRSGEWSPPAFGRPFPYTVQIL